MCQHLNFQLLLITLIIGHGLAFGQSDAENHYKKAKEYRSQENYQSYLHELKLVDSLVPENPIIWGHLAKAWSLNENADSAFLYFSKRIKLACTEEFIQDRDFEFLRDSPNWTKEVVPLINHLQVRKTDNCEISFQLSELDLHPEGLVYNPLDSSWLVASIRKRKIVKWKNGKETDFIPSADQGLGAVMNLKLDEEAGILYVVSCILPEMEGYKDGYSQQSALHVYAAEDGLFLHKIEHYDATDEHAFGDVVLYRDGSLFISDSYQPLIFSFNKEDGLQEHISSEALKSPQGIVIHPDSALLYVADYSKGILCFDLFTGELLSRTLETNTHSLKGIDGLYWHKNRLIAIQNGSIPQRILSLSLTENRIGVTSSTALINDHPLFNEPTQGYIQNGYLHFIANSPWGYYSEDYILDTSDLEQPTILKLKLN